MRHQQARVAAGVWCEEQAQRPGDTSPSSEELRHQRRSTHKAVGGHVSGRHRTHSSPVTISKETRHGSTRAGGVGDARGRRQLPGGRRSSAGSRSRSGHGGPPRPTLGQDAGVGGRTAFWTRGRRVPRVAQHACGTVSSRMVRGAVRVDPGRLGPSRWRRDLRDARALAGDGLARRIFEGTAICSPPLRGQNETLQREDRTGAILPRPAPQPAHRRHARRRAIR